MPSAIDMYYEVPQEGVMLSKIFKIMEEMKQANGRAYLVPILIDSELIEYVVSQTSLEQVFLRFANEQEMEEAFYTQQTAASAK